MKLRRILLSLILTTLAFAFWPSISHAEVNRLNLSPLEEGIYIDPAYQDGVAKIGARIAHGWIQEIFIKIEREGETVYLTGSIPIFDSKPADVWLYESTDQFKRKGPSLSSLRIIKSDREGLTGFLQGKELVTEFAPGAEL